MTLHRVQRHAQRVGDFCRIHFFLITEHYHHPRPRRQSGDERLQPFRDEDFPRPRRVACLGQRVGRELLAMIPTPDLVDAAVAGDAAQPRDDVRVGLEAAQAAIQLEEDLLR